MNTFFSTPKGGASHTFNGRGKKRIDYILTRQRDRKLVRNVTVHPQPSSLPISDHNIVSAPVKLLGHFARNRRLRVSAKPPVDRRRLVTDPQLRQEVATAVGSHLRANPPGDSNVDDVEAAFAAAIMRTAELVIPPQERRRPGRGWSGDAQTEAELQTTTDAMHAAWQRLKTDTRDAQLRRAVRKACNWLKRVRSAAVIRFLERHVVELEKQLPMAVLPDDTYLSGACHYLTNRFQMEAPVAPSRGLQEGSAKPSLSASSRRLRGASKAPPRTLRGGLRTLRGG